jgi:phospholipid transport system transporter-binding protein
MASERVPVQVDEGAPGSVKVSGALTFANAASALDVLTAAVARNGQHTLDLGGVTRADSAGLACVLAVLAAAAQQGRKLTVRNMPEGMHLLASVCEVEGLIA